VTGEIKSSEWSADKEKKKSAYLKTGVPCILLSYGRVNPSSLPCAICEHRRFGCHICLFNMFSREKGDHNAAHLVSEKLKEPNVCTS